MYKCIITNTANNNSMMIMMMMMIKIVIIIENKYDRKEFLPHRESNPPHSTQKSNALPLQEIPSSKN